jgi:hypothetical protein
MIRSVRVAVSSLTEGYYGGAGEDSARSLLSHSEVDP